MWGDDMALYDDPPHECSTFTVATARVGGGDKNTYTLAQSGCKCSINTASASEQTKFAMQKIVVSHTVAFLASVLTTPLVPGMKLVADDGSTYHVRGISTGRAYGGVPAFVFAHCEQQLI